MTFFVRNEEDPLLGLGALDFVVLNDEFFLQDLDGVKLLRCLGLGEHDFAEITFTEHSKEVEVLKSNPSTWLLRLLPLFLHLL